MSIPSDVDSVLTVGSVEFTFAEMSTVIEVLSVPVTVVELSTVVEVLSAPVTVIELSTVVEVLSAPVTVPVTIEFVIYTHGKKVREHLLCYEGKLRTKVFLYFKNVLTKLFN